MANCPKCGGHLKMVDWKQYCPHCNCNIVLYDIQERLMQDADKAEVQHYHFQKRINRMKAAFMGSKLAITRIFTSLIPIVAIVVPWLKGEFKAPFVEFKGMFTLFSLPDMLESFNFDGILGLLNADDGKTAFLFLAVALILLLLTIVLLLVRFGCLTMACGKRGKLRNYIFDIMMLAFCSIATALLMFIPENPYFSIDFVIAPFVYFLLLGVNFGVDIAIFKQGIEVNYENCFVGGIPVNEYFKMVEDGVPQEEIRQEMYRRLTEMQMKKEAELNGEAVKK